MADKKMTQAQRASASRSSKKSSSPEKNSKEPEQLTIEDPRSALIKRLIIACVYLVCFVLLLSVAMGEQGFFLTLIRNLTHGLFGKVSFTIAVPAMLYLCIIHIASGNRPVLMRSVSTLVFIFLCGCLSHLPMCDEALPEGVTLVSYLYNGGINGYTGGLLTGLCATGLFEAFGTIFSYLVLAVAAILFLLAAFQITIPSLIRAFQDRPRYEEDEEEEPIAPRPDPSALLVNTAVQTHHAYKQKTKERQIARQAAKAAEPEKAPAKPALPKRKAAALPAQQSHELMRQIEDDIDTYVPEEEPEIPAPAEEPELIPIVPETPVRIIPENREVRRGVAVEPVNVTEKPPIREDAPAKAAVPAAAPAPIAAEKKITAKDTAAAAQEVAAEIDQNIADTPEEYQYPPISLLRKPRETAADGNLEMKENTRRLNETLASFKIEAHISNVTRGPSVTRYEVELQKGVRLNKLTSCADDIALSLGASGVRIAPVPGKISVVGIEVPNKTVNTVSLREVIDSEAFTTARSKSSFSVGKDIGGSCIIGNIAKLPHMLIAGTTGSGKSVCMNSIIISLLYKASPQEVKLIMVDPKMVELGIYNGIPHLLIPVVTDPKKAAGSLQWAVSEMMRRYKAMSDAGVRDLESYNSMIEGQELEGEKLPQVVVIIDELADLMLVAAKEVEESICRIAQMGRAAGIHLIIATQRPSADVITGLMKANIPSRIAFAVASAMESRIILDTVGAEKLVGKGDMLYAPIGCGKPMRVQGCFVTDAEVEAVAAHVKKENGNTNYDKQIIEEIERTAAQTGNKGSAPEAEPEGEDVVMDEMLPAAAEVVLETGQASVSMLQRRLKLGYARAARIMDLMEECGIVGPYAGSKPRSILITREQWELMKPELMKNGSASVPVQTVIPDVIDPNDE